MSAASAQAAGESSSDPSASSSQSQLPRHEQKKRRQVTVACNECRKRKVKVRGHLLCFSTICADVYSVMG